MEVIYLYDIILSCIPWLFGSGLRSSPGLFNNLKHSYYDVQVFLPMPFNPSLYLEYPPVASGHSGQPLAWSDLKFNPLGLYSLRQRIGMLCDQRGIFTRYQQSFLASDIAWFAAGASEDKSHDVQQNTFHSLFGVSRENTPTGASGNRLRAGVRQHVRQLTFDLVRLISLFPLHSSNVSDRPQCGIELTGDRLW
jgi:hypothetical protein